MDSSSADAVTAEYMESGMAPPREHAIISREIFPGRSAWKNLMPEYGLQFFHLQRRGYPKHPFCVEAAVRDDNVAVSEARNRQRSGWR